MLELKNIYKTFNAGMKMEFETVDNRTLQYSYEDGDNFVFMDMTTYDQIMVPKTLLGDKAKFLLEGTDCLISFHDGTPLNVDLPVDVRANHFRAHAKRKVRVLAHEIYSSG